MSQGGLAHALRALGEGDDVDESQGADERVQVGAGVLPAPGRHLGVGTSQDGDHVAAPHVGQLARQKLHEAIDAVKSDQPRGGVIQPETLTEVRHEGFQLPQDQAVHGVGLGPEELEHDG